MVCLELHLYRSNIQKASMSAADIEAYHFNKKKILLSS
ncbi:hypothetical protein KR50_06330 [Jeotgalibacillus campisalis]|uniref:Uncharacterized protein n=1 Tax=Jeotgalibacillus campisalis TaxID=220754 RepID=A0A0C2W890_9BACL|nr:hypothetical protein KR50_06330 [Jeotgalibacillus campisalis]